MSQPYIGEIRLVGFNFAPVGWALCNGAQMSISQNAALFDLIGTTYGGDGIETYNLPNLLGRVPLHQGSDSLGDTYVIGQLGGVEEVTVLGTQLPSHSHAAQVSGTIGDTNNPNGNFISTAPLALGNIYVPSTSPVTMGAMMNSTGGSGQPHDNIQPFLAVNYIFSLFGIFPSQG